MDITIPPFTALQLIILHAKLPLFLANTFFSGGGEIAMKRHSQLEAVHFEELQVMKFAQRNNNIGDLAVWNLSQVEEIDDEMKEYQDLLAANGKQEVWDKAGVEVVLMSQNRYYSRYQIKYHQFRLKETNPDRS